MSQQSLTKRFYRAMSGLWRQQPHTVKFDPANSDSRLLLRKLIYRPLPMHEQRLLCEFAEAHDLGYELPLEAVIGFPFVAEQVRSVLVLAENGRSLADLYDWYSPLEQPVTKAGFSAGPRQAFPCPPARMQ